MLGGLIAGAGPQAELRDHLLALGPDGAAAAELGAAIAGEIQAGDPAGPPGRPGQTEDEAEAEVGCACPSRWRHCVRACGRARAI